METLKVEPVEGLCPECGMTVVVYTRGKALLIRAHKREEFDRRGVRTGRMVACRVDKHEGSEALGRLAQSHEAAVKHAQTALDRATAARDTHREKSRALFQGRV